MVGLYGMDRLEQDRIFSVEPTVNIFDGSEVRAGG
jgi:hypothetical protein